MLCQFLLYRKVTQPYVYIHFFLILFFIVFSPKRVDIVPCAAPPPPPPYSFFFFFLSFPGPHPQLMEVPRLGVYLGAAAAGLHYSHSNVGSERLQPTPQHTTMPDH